MAISFSAAKAEARAEIDAQFGPIPSQLSPVQQAQISARRDNLAFSIASQSPYVRDNAEVQPGTMAVVPSAMFNGAGSLSGNGLVSVGEGTLL
jgi:hypothetical protein